MWIGFSAVEGVVSGPAPQAVPSAWRAARTGCPGAASCHSRALRAPGARGAVQHGPVLSAAQLRPVSCGPEVPGPRVGGWEHLLPWPGTRESFLTWPAQLLLALPSARHCPLASCLDWARSRCGSVPGPQPLGPQHSSPAWAQHLIACLHPRPRVDREPPLGGAQWGPAGPLSPLEQQEALSWLPRSPPR